jgi:putative FmdB family regulatory protein
MPTYEYECLGCRRTFEVEQGISEPALTECPDCGGQVRRLIGAGSTFIIKGPGGGSGRREHGKGGGCSLEETGTTCCGREERCEKPPCGSGGK